jgi:hypothetical protein
MSRRLEARIPEPQVRVELIETVYYESKRAGLEPSLVLGSCKWKATSANMRSVRPMRAD